MAAATTITCIDAQMTPPACPLRARTCGQKAVAPADAAITKDVGQQLVTLICSEGSELDRAFEGAGLVVEGQLDVHKLEHIFADHCVVMRGHLPHSSWPRHRRRSGEDVPSLMCTCCHFMMHGSCEHMLYVRALLKDPAVNLQKIPVLWKRGRKPKTAGAVPQADTKDTKGVTKTISKIKKAPRKV